MPTKKATAKKSKTASKKKSAAKKPISPKKGARGYKAHLAGSRKEQIHKLYDQKGQNAAIKKGLELGLKESTIKTWTTTWRRDTPNKGKNSSKAESKKAA